MLLYLMLNQLHKVMCYWKNIANCSSAALMLSTWNEIATVSANGGMSELLQLKKKGKQESSDNSMKIIQKYINKQKQTYKIANNDLNIKIG